MKVSEIYAELGFKLSGDSKTNLEEFEKTLLGIANAAKQAVAALAQLSGMQVPKNFRPAVVQPSPAPSPAPAVPGAQPPVAPPMPQTAVPPAPPPQPIIRPTVPSSAPVVQSPPAVRSAPKSAVLPAPRAPQPTPPASNPQSTPPPVPVTVVQNPTNAQNSGSQGGAVISRALLMGLKVLGLGTMVLAIKKLVSTITGWVGASMKAAVSTELFSRQTGLSRKSMQEWELASQKAELAEGEAADAMESFTQKWQHMRVTGEGAAPFGMLGIDPSAGPEAIFRKFQERTKGMSDAEAVYFGTLLGFSKNFAAFLHNQRGEIRRFNNEVLSDKEQKNVTELNAAWIDLTGSLGRLRDKIVSDLAPALAGLMTTVTSVVDYFSSHGQQRQDVLKSLGALSVPGAGAAYGPLVSSYEALKNLFGYKSGGEASGATTTNNITNNISGVMDPDGVRKAAEQGTQDAMRKSTSSAYYQRHQLLGGPTPASP